MIVAQAPVLIERKEGVAWLTLNRPRALNAMDVALMEMLRERLAELAIDPDVRCVVLRGAGSSFCAGGDLGEIQRRQRDADGNGAHLEHQARMLVHHAGSVALLRNMPKPTVAVIHGHAIGGGFSLALAADLRIADRSARLRAGYAARSLSGDFGISYLLTHTVGASKARELMLLDPVIDGEEAQRLGLVTVLCEADALAASVEAVAADLASRPTIALGRMKDNIAAAETSRLDEVIGLEAINQRISAATRDAREAGRAFAEARSPAFEGR